jgi:hypothetical protein
MADNIDPLDVNVNDIDTSRPILPAKMYDLRVKSAKREPTKANDGSERLTIVLETTGPETSTRGEPVPAGHQLFHYIGVTERPADGPKRAYTNADIAKGVAGISKAAGLNESPRAIIANPAVLEGKVIPTKVKINAETKEFPESNGVSEFIVKK